MYGKFLEHSETFLEPSRPCRTQFMQPETRTRALVRSLPDRPELLCCWRVGCDTCTIASLVLGGCPRARGSWAACRGLDHAEAGRLGHWEPGLVSRQVTRHAGSSAGIYAKPWSHACWGAGCAAGVFLREGERGLASWRAGEMARGAGVCRSSGLGEGASLRQA